MSLLACSSSSSTLLSSPLFSKPLLSSYSTPLSSNISILSLPKFTNKPFNLFQYQNRRIKVSFLPPFLTKSQDDCEGIKEELLEAIVPLDRGASATSEDQSRVDRIARKLEAANKVKEPLNSKLLNGKWELLYTTSTSILQTGRPKLFRPNGKIYQAINGDTLRAQNMETWPFFNQATANLVPLNSKRVAVKFDTFKIFSLIPIKSRGSGRGQLEITYLDKDLRISRGNQGNLFILKMVDSSYRVPL